MTVLSPSLPPPISSTTRTVSLPTSAARAVLARNCGTAGAHARRVEVFSERARKSRRDNMDRSFPFADESRQRVLRHGHQGMGGFANSLVAIRVLRVAGGCELDEFLAVLGGDVPLQKYVREQIDGFGRSRWV